MRVILQIPIHGDNNLTAGVVKTGGHCRCLTKIAAQAHHPDGRIMFLNGLQKLHSAVLRSIVNKNDLRLPLHGVKDAFQFLV